MLSNPPKLSYNGLTVIVSNPSRFDTRNLLIDATGGKLFSEFLSPEFTRFGCDIRLKEDGLRPLFEGTKCILLLGESAASIWIGDDARNNSLGAIRGSIFYYDGRFEGKSNLSIPMIASFFPQDAADIVDWEGEYNKQADDLSNPDYEEDEEEEDGFSSKRRHGTTRRKNYRFWLQQDIKKCKKIVQAGGKVSEPLFKPDYRLFPKSEELRAELLKHEGEDLYIDLETYWPNPWLKCIGFTFGIGNPIYIFPCYNWNRNWAYVDLPEIIRCFAIAYSRNRVIAHNGAGFDFLVLANKYHLCPPKELYDTMLAMHRCFSDVERSLGHCTSLWTNEPFHKDEGDTSYNCEKDMMKTLQYCGKDVYTMVLIKHAIDAYARRIPGLEDSIKNANDAIRPYMLATLQGIYYRQDKLDKILKENDRLMTQYLRICEYLVGKDNLIKIRGSGKSSLLSSSTQAVRYFHDMLGYSVVARGKVKDDGTRAPSLGKKAMFKLRLKYPDNPMIDLILAYREIAKESSSLRFIPWKTDEELERAKYGRFGKDNNSTFNQEGGTIQHPPISQNIS